MYQILNRSLNHFLILILSQILIQSLNHFLLLSQSLMMMNRRLIYLMSLRMIL